MDYKEYRKFTYGNKEIFVPITERRDTNEKMDKIKHLLILENGKLEILISNEGSIIPDLIGLAKKSGRLK